MNIQQRLLNIGNALGYRTWLSKKQSSKTISSLKDEKMISAFDDAIEESKYIDCIYFNGDKEIPAIIKICNGKQVVEAMCRLINIKEQLPRYFIKFILLAPDNCKEKIFVELTKPIFKNFPIKFLPLSKINNLKNILK